MDTHIVLFMNNSAEERRIIRSLKSGGVRVAKTQSFGELHSYFSSIVLNAVVVPLSVLNTYHINPRKHLYEAKSTLAIITWNCGENNNIETQIFSICEGSTDDKTATANFHKAEKVALLIRASNTSEENGCIAASDCDASYALDLTKLPELTLHHKMRNILDVIAAAGSNGISTDDIIREIWPNSQTNRLNDLQSYVSKLRGTLKETSGFKILYKEKRYKLFLDKK